MKEQLKEAITVFEVAEGKTIDEKVTSPAARHLREANDNCKKLVGTNMKCFIQLRLSYYIS